MPIYSFRAREIGSEIKSGTIETENEARVVLELEKKGLFPIEIKQIRSNLSLQLKKTGTKIRHKDLSLLMQQLYDLVSSGIGIIHALELIQAQTQKKDIKKVLASIIDEVRGGKHLSEAMSIYPDSFSPLIINLIRSGEISGALEKVLRRLADFYEQHDDIRTKIKAALAYPIFVTSVGILTIVVLLVFVIPRITSIFVDVGQSLPLITRFLITTSNFLADYWWIFAALIVGLIWSLRSLSFNETGKRLIDRLILRMPIFGDLRIKNDVARFSRTLETLLSNGVPILQALELVKDVLNISLFQDELRTIKEKVSQGARLKECISNSRFLPITTANMIAIGEESGQLENSLKRVANSYERAIDRQLKLATSLLEPILILIIGSIVGLIVMAILLPIFQINFLIR